MNNLIHPPIGMAIPMSSSRITQSNPYGLGYGKNQQGVVEKFARQYDQGMRFFIRHRPFGEISGGPMDLDAAAEVIRDQDWKYILDDYDKATLWFYEK